MTKRLLIILALIIGCLPGLASAALNDADAYYALDETPGFLVDSTGTYADMNNSGADQVPGLLNTSADFEAADGSDVISGPTITYGSDDFTINIWYKQESAATSNRVVYEQRDADRISFLIDSGNTWRFLVTGSTDTYSVITSDTPTTGTYEMATLVRKGSNITTYVDGSVVDQQNVSLGTVNGLDGINLGNDDTLASDADGEIDELGVWKRALSSSEVTELYNSGAGFNPYIVPVFEVSAFDNYTLSSVSSFSSYLASFGANFTTSNGTRKFTTLTDMSGNGNDLTNNGATYNQAEEAYDFDGSSYMTAENKATKDTELNITVKFKYNDDGNRQDILNQLGFSGQNIGWKLWVFEGTDKPVFSVYYGGTELKVESNALSDGQIVTLNAFFNQTEQSIKEDGVLVADADRSSAGNLSDPITDLRLGTNAGASTFLNGTLYNLEITNSSGGRLHYSFTDWDSYTDNITINSNESGGYFSRTYTNHNTTRDLTASIHQSKVTFNASNRVSGASITDFTASTNSNGGSATDTDTNPTLNLTAANNYAFNFTKTGYYDTTLTGINVTALEQTTETFSVYDHKLNITINVTEGSVSEQEFTVDIYSDDHEFTEKLSTTNGEIIANLTDGNYTVWINDSVHPLQNYSVELSSDQNFTNVTLNTSASNSVSIRFYDEETNNLIDDRNVTAYFTGSIVSYNKTTSNGTLLFELITPQTYEITYNAPGYAQRKYTFTLTNRTFNELDLYLLNETNDELVLTSVQDSFLDPVPNAVIRAQKKNLSGTNYYTVETCTTDNNGECLLHLVLYDTTYRFLIIVDGVTVLTSSDQTIKQSTLSFRVNLETDVLEDINNIFGITGSLFYDKNNKQIEFTWNDPNSLGVTSCLDIDTRQGANTNDYNLSCTTSASGTIILPIDTNLSVTYEATGYVLVDGNRYDLDTISVAGNTFSSGLGLNGLFIFGFIVLGIAAFTGLWNPVVGPITTAAVIWFFNYIGFITLGTAAVTSLIIGAIMVAYLSRS